MKGVPARWPDQYGPAGDHVVPMSEFRADTTSLGDAGGWCWVSIELGDALYPYTCTRPHGHSGRHVAGDGMEICAVWGEL